MDLFAKAFKVSILQRMSGTADYPAFTVHAKEIDNVVRKSIVRGSESFYMASMANASQCIKLTYDILVLPVYLTEAEWVIVDFPLELSRRVLLKERVTNSIARGQKRSKARTIVNNNIRQLLNGVRSKKSLNVDLIGKLLNELLWFKEFHVKNSVNELQSLKQKLSLGEDLVTSVFLDQARSAYGDLYSLVKLFNEHHQNLMPEDKIHKLYKFVTNFSANNQALKQSVEQPQVGYNSLFVTNSLADCVEVIDLFLKFYGYINEEIEAIADELRVQSTSIHYSNAFAVMATNAVVRPYLIYYNYLTSLYARLHISDTVGYCEADDGVLALYKKLDSLSKANVKEIKENVSLLGKFKNLLPKRLSGPSNLPIQKSVAELELLKSVVDDKTQKLEAIFASDISEELKYKQAKAVILAYKRKIGKMLEQGYLDY